MPNCCASRTSFTSARAASVKNDVETVTASQATAAKALAFILYMASLLITVFLKPLVGGRLLNYSSACL
jgi:hypothetical protein